MTDMQYRTRPRWKVPGTGVHRNGRLAGYVVDRDPDRPGLLRQHGGGAQAHERTCRETWATAWGLEGDTLEEAKAGFGRAPLSRRRLPPERLRAPGGPPARARVVTEPHRPPRGHQRRGIVPAHLLSTRHQGGASCSQTHVIDPEDLFTISAGGFSATADAFARDENTDGLWFVSMVGSQTALKAIWASLLKQPPDTAHIIRGADGMALTGGYQRCIIPYETIGTWTTKIARLPATGGWHALVYTRTAEYAHEKDSFLLLAQSPEEAPALHHRFLDRRSPLPLHDSWAGWLWERGISEGEIVPLQSVGVFGYRCSPKAQKLRDDLSDAVASGSLTLPREETAAAVGATP